MKRNYGIDILKIFMMFLIVCGHVIWHGGYWNLVASDGPVYILVIDVVAACAVNCYAMSSGFLLYDSNPNKKKLLSLWKQVFFTQLRCFYS